MHPKFSFLCLTGDLKTTTKVSISFNLRYYNDLIDQRCQGTIMIFFFTTRLHGS